MATVLGKKVIGTIAYMGGVPALPEPFVWSLTGMIQYSADYLVETNERIDYQRAVISYHAAARNNLVETMAGDWIIMLDTDHQFEPDLAARLLFCANKLNLDVLTGVYTFKAEPFIPVIFKKQEKGFEPLVIVKKNTTVFEIDSAGAGCLFVRRKVFDRIKKELKESPFDVSHPFSEDHSFFLRLKKLGIKAYCNPHIECHHLYWKPTQLSDFIKGNLLLGRRKDIKGLK